MDQGGFDWTLMTIVGPVVLALVILFALLRNRSSKASKDRTEQATHRLYEEEEAARRDRGD